MSFITIQKEVNGRVTLSNSKDGGEISLSPGLNINKTGDSVNVILNSSTLHRIPFDDVLILNADGVDYTPANNQELYDTLKDFFFFVTEGSGDGGAWFTTDGVTVEPSTDPSLGDYLYNTVNDTLFKRVNDGVTDFWFDISTSSGSDKFSLFGWQDFADDGTSEGSPIQQTNVLGGTVQLTNNNQGVLTDGNTNLNSVTTLSGVTDILDSTFGTLEFSNRGLKVNDTFLMRVNLNVSVNTIPSELFLDLKFYDDINGTGNLVFTQSTQFLSINDTAGFFKDDSVLMSFFLGDSIKEGSCVLDLRGSTAFDVEVIGYNVQIHRK